MGHYDEDYAHDEEQSRKHIKARNKKAKELFREAVIQAVPANEEQFHIKYKEMLFWLENN